MQGDDRETREAKAREWETDVLAPRVAAAAVPGLGLSDDFLRGYAEAYAPVAESVDLWADTGEDHHREDARRAGSALIGWVSRAAASLTSGGAIPAFSAV